ncbi:Protein of unknown function [Gryllus bimaculatus]|nr:Protein of unknown function [Gryllus bimaculatus]
MMFGGRARPHLDRRLLRAPGRASRPRSSSSASSATASSPRATPAHPRTHAHGRAALLVRHLREGLPPTGPPARPQRFGALRYCVCCDVWSAAVGDMSRA